MRLYVGTALFKAVTLSLLMFANVTFGQGTVVPSPKHE